MDPKMEQTVLHEKLSKHWATIQSNLFPWLKEELGPLGNNHLKLVTILELVRLEEHVSNKFNCSVGRPQEERKAIARAFVAKAVFNLPTTRALLDRLDFDLRLRRICGWERRSDIPSESTFSRAFAEFASTELANRVHGALVEKVYEQQSVCHVSRDSTQIEGREKPNRKEKREKKIKKRGRPRKGEEVSEKPLRRLDQQPTMSLEEMLADLPKDCDIGTKRNSQGYQQTWTGYKMHLDVGDGDVPLSALVTSASIHDSQVAIPLAAMTAGRVTSYYDLMDAAYDAEQIKDYSRSLGHVPIIDINPRRDIALKQEIQEEGRRRRLLHFKFPEQYRYDQRSSAERVNARLKDDFGGRFVRVQGNAKVTSHLMFGLIALTGEQIWRFLV
jgi:hypothetical protein